MTDQTPTLLTPARLAEIEGHFAEYTALVRKNSMKPAHQLELARREHAFGKELSALLSHLRALEAENARLRTMLGKVVAFMDDCLSAQHHFDEGVYELGVTDVELTPDGSLMLSEVRAALQPKEPK